ncbi:hypothetical protein GC173_01585 [bacterium]|nr:hypothetical protein [bacterium]
MLEVLLRYALVVNVDVDLAKVKSALTEARDPYIRRTVMSVAEKLIRQGREEGREEGIGFGRLQSSRNSLMRFLQVRFGADVATDLKPRIDAVEDPDLLEELLGEVYGAAGVEDVHRIMVQRGV